ncbi:hypothetical protein K503DRAFT_788143, partial [Rhizopogon vinicolor AM-OR11-026]
DTNGLDVMQPLEHKALLHMIADALSGGYRKVLSGSFGDFKDISVNSSMFNEAYKKIGRAVQEGFKLRLGEENGLPWTQLASKSSVLATQKRRERAKEVVFANMAANHNPSVNVSHRIGRPRPIALRSLGNMNHPWVKETFDYWKNDSDHMDGLLDDPPERSPSDVPPHSSSSPSPDPPTCPTSITITSTFNQTFPKTR